MWSRRKVLGAGAAALVLLPARQAFAATDELRVALRAEPPHLDPTLDDSPVAADVAYQNIFEGLTHIDQQGQVQPGLAKSWTLSPDGLAYTFALQSEVNYHDGTAFDAAHVVFALKRLLAGSAPDRALYSSITDVAAVDEMTTRISLKQPDAALLFNLGLAAASIVAPESAENNRSVPLGTGPFAFVEWDPGQGIVLERNEDYWGDHPRISQVSYFFMPDPAAAAQALLSHAVDAYPLAPSAAALQPLQGNPAFRIVTGKGPADAARIGAWDARLDGMWTDAPVEASPLADVRWTTDQDTTPPAQGGAPAEP